MDDVQHLSDTTISENDADFSLVLGGPLFQLFRRARLSGDAMELAWQRSVLIGAIAWVPLLILSMIGGQALSGIRIPFLYDVEAHVRFLVALPLLVAAELVVHSRISPAVNRFIERRMITAEDLPKFYEAIESGKRIRNSIAVELGLIILVYTVGLWVWWTQISISAASWYSGPEGLHLAGYWYAFISIPIFQFILIRWYLRFFLWFRFLWQVSRLDLRLIATHPDRAAGLGLLGSSTYAFGPILFAEGAVLSGLIASRVLYDGQDLMSFKVEAGGLIVFFLLFVLSPLLVFVPKLALTKRCGLRDYGRLASRYIHEFEGKWIKGGEQPHDELLGSGDIQSLADLGNSFTVVQEMRPVPFGMRDVLRLGATTAAPLLPLGLTILSLEELVTRIIQILF